MDGKPRPTSGCPSVLRLPDVHKESETPSTSGEGERKFTESSLVYIIPDFPAGANFCRIFFRWQQMTTIGIQCSIRQPVQYSSAGIRNPVFRQQLFAARRLFIQANEASRQPLYYLTGQYSPARLIFFTGQISDFRLRTTLLSRRLRRRQPRFRSHKQINKRTFQKNSQKNFKNNSKSNRKEPK